MHLNGFFAYLQFEKRYSRHTLEAYKNDLSQFAAFLQEQGIVGGEHLEQITDRQVRAWVMHQVTQGRQPKSVHRNVSALRSYYKYLLRKEVISKNPMTKVVVPKTGKRLPLFIDEAGMKTLQQEAPLTDQTLEPARDFEWVRNQFILDILYKTGMRRSELLGLSEASFDVANRTVRVLGKGNKERLIPLGDETLLWYHTYLTLSRALFGPQEALLLTHKGQPAYPNLIYRIVRDALEGHTTLTRKSPHVLRHTFATHLSNRGAELQAIKELLGHASLASTQVYTHNAIDKLKEIYQKAHPKGSSS